jgi:hypothetical protein
LIDDFYTLACPAVSASSMAVRESDPRNGLCPLLITGIKGGELRLTLLI